MEMTRQITAEKRKLVPGDAVHHHDPGLILFNFLPDQVGELIRQIFKRFNMGDG